MARDGLAALASRSASSYPQGPLYASPRNPRLLIKASTLAIYAPGATIGQIPGNPGFGPQSSNCSWGTTNGSLFLDVTITPDPDSALGGFEFDIQYAHHSQNGFTFNGTQSVKGIGEQATAIFGTANGSPEVDLYVLSGNAEIEMRFADDPFSPPLSRATKLAADVAMVRDVLADLRRA